ncbi:MAG: DUF397 domain-containing protein [Acidimicrobiales bacterium]
MNDGRAQRPGWIKAKRCSTGTCVEVLLYPDRVSIRDSKQKHLDDQPIIEVSAADFNHFLDRACDTTRSAELAGGRAVIAIEGQAHGGVVLRSGETALEYDAAEWVTFVAGAIAGDFPIPAPA